MECWKCGIFLGLTLALMMSACAAPQSLREPETTGAEVERPRGPRRIIVAIRGSAASFAKERTNPAGSSGSVAGLDALVELVHAGLTHSSNTGVVLPQLADTAPSLENDLWRLFPDGRMEITWKINPATRWQDDVPVTTADLLFTAEVEQDTELPIPRNPAYGLIEGIEVVDARTVTVRWKQPFIDANRMFSYESALPLPKHLLENAYLADKAGFLALPYWSQESVGAGPFKVREWVMDSHLVLTANPTYVLGRPKIDEITVKFVPDPNTLVANVLAGVDLTVGRALTMEQGLEVRGQWKDGGLLIASRGWVPINSQFINTSPPIVADVRFRRAMLYAINRQELADSFQGGLTSVAHSFVSPDKPEYQAIEGSIVRYEYDPRRSFQMVEELGYRRGSDGFFSDALGQRLSVELRTNPVGPNRGPAAAVANYWRQVGLAVEEDFIPPQRAQDREYRAQYPAFELIANRAGLSSNLVWQYHSVSRALPENGFQAGGNSSRYKHPDLDVAIERYVSTIPTTERMQALAQIVNHQTENLTILGLFFTAEPTVAANRLQNVTPMGERATEAWNAHEWDLKS